MQQCTDQITLHPNLIKRFNNQHIEINIPSKTFIIGEYLALLGKPCLILSDDPCFQLQARKTISTKHQGIPNGSPAWNFIQQHNDFFQHYHLEFIDPHQGAGGFGASSAQFIAVYLLYHYHQATTPSVFTMTQINALLDSYLSCAWNGEGMAPSGADVVAQLTQGFVYFDRQNNIITQHDLSFEHIQYQIQRTGNKVATHQHLLTLNENHIKQLPNLANKARQALDDQDDQTFIACIQEYSAALQAQQLTTEATIQLLDNINQRSGVLASKGCGALGADVIFIVCGNF